MSAAPAGPPPAGFSEVAFTTSDAVTLSGWYSGSDNGAAVVVVPGSGSSRTGALAQAQVLTAAGYGILLYDPRGHGASAGRSMDFGWAGDADVRAAVDFLRAQPGVTAVAALGLSMGGEQVLGAAATDPRIEAVVAEGATNRVAADLAWLPGEYGWRGQVQVALEHAQEAVTRTVTPYPPPAPLREAIAQIAPRPVLLIAAGDRPDERAAAQFNAGPTTEVWVVPGAGHTAGLATDPAGWRERVVGFFDHALL